MGEPAPDTICDVSIDLPCPGLKGRSGSEIFQPNHLPCAEAGQPTLGQPDVDNERLNVAEIFS
jgi:hypothetical protein